MSALLRTRNVPPPSIPLSGSLLRTRVGLDLLAVVGENAVSLGKSAALDQLRAFGLTDGQIKLLLDALHSTPEQLISLGKEQLFAKLADGKTLALAYATAQINEQAVNAMMGLGFSRADAEALAATGAKPDALLGLGKARLKELLGDIDSRLRKDGVDLGKQAAMGLGIPPERLGAIVKGAGTALDIFTTLTSASDALRNANYSRSQWDNDTFKSDQDLVGLTRALDQMAQESEAQRAQRSAALRATGLKLAGTATVAGPWGWAAAALIAGFSELANYLGWFNSGPDGNAEKFGAEAKAYALRLWNDYGFVPPSFDSAAYSLDSYAQDALKFELELLDASEAEIPWRERWRKLVTWAFFQPLEGSKVEAHPAVVGLLSRSWIPIQFSEWLGGAISPVMARNVGGSFSVSGLYTPGDKALAGTLSYFDLLPIQVVAFRILPALARENFFSAVEGGAPPRWWPAPLAAGDDYSGIQPSLMPIAPRSGKLQAVLRDRMAATVGTLVAASQNVQIESVVGAAVRKSHELVDAHGFSPAEAARDFRDVFLAAIDAASVARSRVPTRKTSFSGGKIFVALDPLGASTMTATSPHDGGTLKALEGVRAALLPGLRLR